MLMEHRVSFSNSLGIEYNVPLRNRITLIWGGYSGIGKSKFLKLTGETTFNDDVSFDVTSDLPTYVLPIGNDVTTSTLVFNNDKTSVLVMDETIAVAFKNQLLSSKHYLVIISRNDTFIDMADCRSAHLLYFNSLFGFVIESLFKIEEPVGVYDEIITEGNYSCSENRCIRSCFPEIIEITYSSKGKDKMRKAIRAAVQQRNHRRILCLIDLAAGVSSWLSIIKSSLSYECECCVLPYTSFEAMLFYSKLVQQLNIKFKSVTNYYSVETAYEALLQYATINTPIQSNHGSFSDCFITDCTTCGKSTECVYKQQSFLLKTLFSEDGLPLLKWYWNTYHPEWVPLSDKLTEGLKRSYNPDGFKRIPLL